MLDQLLSQLNQQGASALEQIQQAADLKTLEDLRVSVLGKKGSLSEVLKGVGSLAPADRPKIDRQLDVPGHTHTSRQAPRSSRVHSANGECGSYPHASESSSAGICGIHPGSWSAMSAQNIGRRPSSAATLQISRTNSRYTAARPRCRTASAERARRADDEREGAEKIGGLAGLGHAFHGARFRDIETDLDHALFEQLAVLALVDGVGLGADHFDAVFGEDA